jgi:membrane protein
MSDLKLSRWHNYVWAGDLAAVGLFQQIFIRCLRFLQTLMLELSDGQLNLRAMSLVFTTILSFVPLLAVSFSVLKAFGVHGQVEPLLLAVFSHLGDRGPEISATIIGFVDNVRVGLLGAVGIAFLFYSVISLLQKIEEAFNYTWYIGQLRALNERFSRYLSVVLVGLVLVFAGIALTAKLLNNEVTQSVNDLSVIGDVLHMLANALPYVCVISAFTFTYYFVPNTKVQFRAALVGGLVAGVLWQSMGWVYAVSIANASAQVAIYAGFAVLFFFMFWLYLNWFVLLLGSSIAYLYQHPERRYFDANEFQSKDIYTEECLSMDVLLIIAQNYYLKQEPATETQLAKRCHCSLAALRSVLTQLFAHHLIVPVDIPGRGYVPALPAEDLSLARVYLAIRHRRPLPDEIKSTTEMNPSQIHVIDRVEQIVSNGLAQQTLKDLISSEQPDIISTPSTK